ncbi:MAG: hypothetical protein ACKOGA_09120, partial [Planctomycetaceae bacterium]
SASGRGAGRVERLATSGTAAIGRFGLRKLRLSVRGGLSQPVRPARDDATKAGRFHATGRGPAALGWLATAYLEAWATGPLSKTRRSKNEAARLSSLKAGRRFSVRR